MRFKLKRRSKVTDDERQLALQLLATLYADIEEVPRKPPSPEHPKPALLQMRKAGAA